MLDDTLLIEDRDPGIRILTLNRPAKRNAINRSLFAALIEQFTQLDRDPAVRVAILTGADPAFCGGVDLADVRDTQLLAERRTTGISPPSVLLGVRTPVLAAVNGPCVAGGLELALACDVILADPGATFVDNHVRLGLIPSWGGAALLPIAVGTRRAKEMALTGRSVAADEANLWGLVSHVAKGEPVLKAAFRVATQISQAPPSRVEQLLRIYDSGEGLSRAGRVALERQILLESEPDVRHVPDR
jgi:enoyl-CoA hydratase